MGRMIEADALKIAIDKEIFRHDTIDHVFQIIDDAPTIEAVEVVRCQECKHWRNTDAEKIPTASIACGNMHADDFCSYGERTDHE